ncbi:proactivator polypeptide-like 1 [Abrus precatorius]|uniref:Proactivator polypeptide-like 1 n=1 Tax=Abrus precatorius TaxID=3816 RepID=A0A8B8L3I1_ABRPR|nr:proactivator polypeptide-like 1 [Abrus precatorius]
MEKRMKLLFLVLLGAAWACDAREVANPDHWNSNTANYGNSELSRKPDICACCEEYTARALDYLNENKTQIKITDILHNTCYRFSSIRQKCITLVDYYAPQFFLEIASIKPGELCHKANLCQGIAYISLKVEENSCEFCKDTVSAALAKLKDPNTEVELIETLLKGCHLVERYTDKCKRMVFDYGPLVFDNAEKFLEMTDICSYALNFMPTRLHQWLANKPSFISLNYGNNVLIKLIVYLLRKISMYIIY